MNKCVICNESTGKLITLTQRGVDSLCEFSRLRKDKRVLNELEENEGGFVHEDCRKWYNNRKRIATEAKEATTKKTRQSIASFDWKTNCFLCSKPVNAKSKWHFVETLTIKNTILKNCDDRISKDSNDSWAMEIKGRVYDCVDFVAAEARYHQNCRALFSSGRQLKPSKALGRPTNVAVKSAFEKACDVLENEAEIYTVSEFAEIIRRLSPTNETFSHKHLVKLLQDKYRDHLIITSQGAGKTNIITFVDTARFLIEEKFKSSTNENIDCEMERMTSVVGNLIKDEIRMLERSEVYPSSQELEDVEFLESWIPKTLLPLLKILIPNKVKRAAIGHAIVSASRKNFNLPILVGLGVELDHCFGSKWLNNHLSRLGFSITNDEVRRFKQDMLETGDSFPEIPPDSFVQFSADNVDHNVRTIDGKHTFHGMGMIACVTPSLTGNVVVRRSKKRKKMKELTMKKGPTIYEYFRKVDPPLSIKFQSITSLRAAASLKQDKTSLYDSIWISSWLLKDKNVKHCSWSGYMQVIHSSKTTFDKSTVLMLPIIDLQPSDPTCVYSTLKFIESQANKFGIETPCVTFDQPLWYKAVGIIAEKNLNIVCRLGGFHLLMSFLGSIGHLMGGSGIEGLLEEVYASNVIHHIISGKAYARALRGHMLVHATLLQMILEELIESGKISLSQLQYLSRYQPGEDLQNFKAVENDINNAVTQWKETFSEYRTARYWLQYVDYVAIIKDYIKAERTGDWLLHLASVEKMLNLFAATGHIHYTKSARLYLQHMIDLEIKHPTIYQHFVSFGHHSIRRSDRFWAGLWSDLVIEQVMMRSIKSSGGLTRGRGFTESVRSQWVATAHQVASIHEGMTGLTKTQAGSSDQHVEMSEARKQRDSADCQKFYSWLTMHNPFLKADKRLKSLSTGITVENEHLNCDKAEEVGKRIHETLDGVAIAEAKVKRKECIICLDVNINTVNIGKKAVSINPTLLFNRLSALAGREENIEKYFHFELTSYPTSLFKEGMLRKPDKASLRRLLLTKEISPPPSAQKVIDGGALLHQIHWPKNITYGELLVHHVTSVRQQYGNCHVVFDGYDIPSVKDHEHNRRSAKVKSAEIQFTDDTSVLTKREDFLSNSKNKSLFISKLAKMLTDDQQEVTLSMSDADTDITKSALEKASESIVQVFADDTDIVVLLMHHWKNVMFDIVFTSERSGKSWSIKNSCGDLPSDFSKILPFIHAFSGCDTTSAVYSLGKPSIFKTFKAQKDLIKSATKFSEAWLRKEVLKAVGIDIFVKLYGGKKKDSLGSLRYAKYQDMAAKGTIEPSKLPPTDDSAFQHCLRVYFQLMVWETLDQFCMDPIDWGWQKIDDAFIPIQNTIECAPDEILKFVRCRCKAGCSSANCSCKKHGLSCVAACKNCRGDCENSQCEIIEEDDDEDEDHDENIFNILANL